MRALFVPLGLVILAGGCGSTDPCAGRSGACIALTVKGSLPAVNALAITVDRPAPETRTTPMMSLEFPVTIGLNLPATVSGAVDIDITALGGGAAVASGRGQASVMNQRGAATITLSAVGSGGAVDLAMGGGGGDMAPLGDMLGPTVPGAPASVVASSGNGQATVTWSAPASNGGSPITGYTVISSGGGSMSTGPSTTTAQLNGLTNGTSYTFSVSASNAIGTGASASSNPVTPTATPTAPSAPTHVTATADVDHGATITWTAANNNGSALVGYTIAATQLAGTLASPGPTATSASVTGLTPGSQYTFTVTATNGVGTGPASLASSPIVAATKPGAPTGVAAITNVDQGATVTWTRPASDGYSTITKYVVTASPGGATASTSDGNATSAAVTGLSPGTSYTFSVAAYNLVGAGAPSPASPAIVGCTGTSAPESCFNGVDENCNGLIDCADPACSPVATCVPPIAGASYGTLVNPANPCPNNTTAQGTYYSNFNNGTASCVCPSALVGSCQATFFSNTDTNAGEACLNPVTQSGNATGISTSCTNVPMNVEFTIGNFSGCSCNGPNSTTPSPDAASNHFASANFCGASSVGGGCTNGNVCVPTVPSGEAQCVLLPGNATCDAGHPYAATWYTSYSDSRSCGACNSQPTPTPYEFFYVFTGPNCSTSGSGYRYGVPVNACTPASVKQMTGSVRHDLNPNACYVYPNTNGSIGPAGTTQLICCQ